MARGIAEQADVGCDANVVEEERGRTGATEGQGAGRVNDGIEAVNEVEVLVEQHAAGQHTDQAPVGVMHGGGRVDDEAAHFGLAHVGAGIGGVDDSRPGPDGQFRADREQLGGAEDLGFRTRLAGQCCRDDGPGVGILATAGDVQKVQEIELVFQLCRVEQTGYGLFRFAVGIAQGPGQSFGGGQAGDGAADAFRHAFKIAVGDREVGTHLGDEQTVEVIAAPISQRGHRQRQHDAERDQRQQQ